MPDLASQLQHAIARERANDAEIARTNAENRDLRIEIASKDQTIAELRGQLSEMDRELKGRQDMLASVQGMLNERTAKLRQVGVGEYVLDAPRDGDQIDGYTYSNEHSDYVPEETVAGEPKK